MDNPIWGGIVLAHVGDVLLFGGAHVLVLSLAYTFIANEGLSITENLAEMDIIVNDSVKKYLSQVKKKGEEETTKKKE